MEVAILYCQDCFFAQRAHAQLLKALDSIVGIDRQKLNLALHTYDLKEIESHSKATQLHRAKAQLVIISHHFLDRLRHESNVKKKASPVNRILRAKRVIAILLSTTPEEVLEGFQEYLVQFPEWHSIELKSSNKLDPEFYKKFSEQVVKIYNVELSNTISFSIFPKKVTKDQPKVVILFKQALEPTDKVTLELTRGKQKEHVGEVMMTNPQMGIIRIPSSISENRTSLIEITVFLNSKMLGTKLVKFEHNLKTSEEDVIDRMSSAIPGFRKALDDHISQQLSRNFRSCEDFTLDSSLELMNDALISKGDDFPTVMHFAVHYGLEQTVCVLLYEGDGLEQSMVKNDVGEVPVDMAYEQGFGNIGQTIKDFCEMTNTFGALQYIKDLCDRHSEELELLSEETRTSTISSVTLMKTEVNGIEEDRGCAEGQQENPEYMFDTEDDINLNLAETVTIRVDSAVEDEQGQMGARPPSQAFQDTQNLHLNVPNRSFTQDPQENVNVNESVESGVISVEAKSVILQSYDVPPPPSPVIMTKPPRKLGSMPLLEIITPHYDVPRGSLGAHYCHIPPTLPEKPSLNNTKPTGPVLSVKSNQNFQSPDGYLVMNSEIKNTEMPPSGTIPSPKPPHKPLRATKPGDPPPELGRIKYPKVLPPVIQIPSGLSKKGFLNPEATSPLPLTKQFSLDSTQEELLELMNDFKNNVYNLRELELLYENWKLRNDVQRDFKARQKELKEIQKEYKKIQEKVRRETKKSGGPISKLLKLIPGGKKKNSVTNMDANSASTIPPAPPHPDDDAERKVSGSSDQGSTVSEASVPDSGVSDPDSDLRCSYVGPSEMPELSPPATVEKNPPARPPKKPSISCDPPPSSGLISPQNSPKVSLDHPPIVEEQSSEASSEERSNAPPPILPQRKDTVDNTVPVNDHDTSTPPPNPPPRPTKMDSPFSYINYEGKTRGLLGLNKPKQQGYSADKPQQRVKSSYENEIGQGK